MTNQEILEKAIQKAIDGGWQWDDYDDAENLARDILQHNAGLSVFDMIFSRSFAKALWGETEILHEEQADYEFNIYLDAWKSHLQKMVISENPIKYLGDNI